MPPVLEESKTPRSIAQDRQSTFLRRATWTALRVVVVVLLAGALVGSWYLARKGFGRQWRHRVVEELHKRGVEASIRRLTLDPFRGLVAQEVRICSYKHRATPLAVNSANSLDVSYV